MSDSNPTESADAAKPSGKKPAVLRGCTDQESDQMTVFERWLFNNPLLNFFLPTNAYEL